MENNELQDFYLPSIHNSIQSALWQIQRGNNDRAIAFLEAAQRSLAKVKSLNPG